MRRDLGKEEKTNGFLDLRGREKRERVCTSSSVLGDAAQRAEGEGRMKDEVWRSSGNTLMLVLLQAGKRYKYLVLMLNEGLGVWSVGSPTLDCTLIKAYQKSRVFTNPCTTW